MNRWTQLGGASLTLVWTVFVLGTGSTASGQSSRAGELPLVSPGTERDTPNTLLNEEDTELLQRKQRLEQLAAESEQRRALMIARGRAFVRLARAGLMPLSAGFNAMAEHAARMERLRRALALDRSRLDEIAAEQNETTQRVKQLEALRPARQKALARARDAVRAAEERDDAFRRAFQTDWSPRERTAVYAARVSPLESARGAGEGFGREKGRLPFPISGRTEITQRRSESGSGKTLMIEGAPDSRVLSVYPGRVAFADEYAELGWTVILDHGDQFYTVSSGLRRIDVAVGEELARGAQLGVLGRSPKEQSLQFEVRQGQDTVDTPRWLGI